MVIRRIQRPKRRIWLTAPKLCEPPEACITISILPWVGQTPPFDRESQSICGFISPVIAPWRSDEGQTMPLHHATRSRSFGWVASISSSTRGRPDGLKTHSPASSRVRMRPASLADRRLRRRNEPFRIRIRGVWVLCRGATMPPRQCRGLAHCRYLRCQTSRFSAASMIIWPSSFAKRAGRHLVWHIQHHL